jgi:hypothetical protein
MTDTRAARRRLFDEADEKTMAGLVAEHHAYLDELAVKNRQRDSETIARGLALPPQGWPELAAWVDEGTWLRVLGEATAELRAELEALRPPAGRRIPHA